MKAYKVKVVTTFVKEIEVEAESPEEAKRLTQDAIDEGTLDATDTLDFDTDVEVKGS